MYEINAMALAYLRALLFYYSYCVCVQQETQFTILHSLNFDIVADLYSF